MLRAVFCGGGPASTGVFTNAAQNGRLSELLSAGATLIERSGSIGAGMIGSYHIPANTLADSLLECLQHSDQSPLLARMAEDPSTMELARYRGRSFPLTTGARFLTKLGSMLSDQFDGTNASCVLTDHTVDALRQTASGSWDVEFHKNCKPDEKRHVGAEYAVLALGAVQPTAHHAKLEIVPGIGLSPYADKLQTSLDVNCMEPQALFEWGQQLGSDPKIAIIGGSHSAFCVALRLVQELAPHLKSNGDGFAPGAITLIHRHPVRLFFDTPAEAIADGYAFDEDQDICPITGRINRMAGLRYDTLEFARPFVVGTGAPREMELLSVNSGSSSEQIARLRKTLEDATVIISAAGHQARAVPVLDENGNEIDVLRDNDGGYHVDSRARLFDAQGDVLPGLLAYGIGAGFRPTPETGGEPSYRGRIDSLWLYQNTIGNIILRTLLDDTTAHQKYETADVAK